MGDVIAEVHRWDALGMQNIDRLCDYYPFSDESFRCVVLADFKVECNSCFGEEVS